MRRIEFRGKTISENKWVYGYFSGIYETEEGQVGCIKDYSGKDNLVNLETLGQYTGNYDKKGKEIFDGDILLFNFDDIGKHKAVVYYDMYYASFNLRPFDDFGFALMHEGTVIGNIHDNPKLLKTSN